jgi:hypothetical protein
MINLNYQLKNIDIQLNSLHFVIILTNFFQKRRLARKHT